MKPADSDYVVIGKIGATYGILGWLKIYTFTDAAADILGYDTWYIEDSVTGWKSIKRNGGRIHGKGVVASFSGYSNPEEARRLTGKKIAVKRSEMPALNQGEYYWADLEGLSVIDQDNKTLGKVTHLMETGANDVLVIKAGDGKEYGIPFLSGSVITSVDLKDQVIRVNWELI